MGLETGTFITDLVTTNPADSDLESQGAAHLRLIKSILQNTFPGSGKAFPIPTTVVKSADYTSVKADFNTTILYDTSGGSHTLTLPTLVAGDAGWEISILKTTTDSNALFITPASGNLQSGEVTGLSKCRRCIPGLRTKALWTGTAWIVERGPRVPVGTVLEFQGATLPVGYEWPNGQTLSSSANYPEFNSVNGGLVTPDRRGRAAFGKGNMGGSDAARITVAGGNFDGTVLNGTGGGQNQTLTAAQLPIITPAGTNATSAITGITLHSRATNVASGGAVTLISDSINATGGDTPQAFVSGTVAGQTFTGTPFGSGNSHPIVPPAIIMNFILVTE